MGVNTIVLMFLYTINTYIATADFINANARYLGFVFGAVALYPLIVNFSTFFISKIDFEKEQSQNIGYIAIGAAILTGAIQIAQAMVGSGAF
jgi:hypothetical protein